jgi:hypothetical protein
MRSWAVLGALAAAGSALAAAPSAPTTLSVEYLRSDGNVRGGRGRVGRGGRLGGAEGEGRAGGGRRSGLKWGARSTRSWWTLRCAWRAGWGCGGVWVAVGG